MPTAVEIQPEVDTLACAPLPDMSRFGHQRLEPWFDPAILAPPATCARVYYDVDRVRHTLGSLGLRPRAIQDPSRVKELWLPPRATRSYGDTSAETHVKADLALDSDALTFATSSVRARWANPGDQPLGISPQVVVSRTRWVGGVHAQGFVLAMSLSGGGLFPTRAGHLQPDESIECAIERAFAFAAAAIRGGVDQHVARTWSSAILAGGYGLHRPLMTLGTDQPLHEREWLYPKRTLMSEYFLQGIADLKLGDATKFMMLAARCAVETQISASGTPGT